ncbi:hypothetical protein PY257_03200 [Ramlibacter sp. H39-3-26]|uniref:hypothetical protein n=1 Tax=Curvibacter soli TaxID=3031331 RepID=UPI0023DC2ACD|nr:hypothetical protein [Ramlibacter sp. H39-3-26]MDF1484195.1 hypothetical protein [Ramlibacter sp. H39-3-26]
MSMLDPTLPTTPADAAAAGTDPVLHAKASDAARKFEGLFITEMLRGMRRSTRELAGEDSIYHDRVNEDMLDLADTLVADAMAGQHAFGIADVILRQLLPSTALKSPTTMVALPR